jgi:hypothetical protein
MVFNSIFGVATFSSSNKQMQVNKAQQLLTRYMFSQLWGEFTKKVLVEFFEEDLALQSIDSKAFKQPNTTKLSQFVQNASKDIRPRLNEPSRITISAVELQLLN